MELDIGDDNTQTNTSTINSHIDKESNNDTNTHVVKHDSNELHNLGCIISNNHESKLEPISKKINRRYSSQSKYIASILSSNLNDTDYSCSNIYNFDKNNLNDRDKNQKMQNIFESNNLNLL